MSRILVIIPFRRPSNPLPSILEPGLPPEIRTVTRFPAQDSASGASKIPTIVYYDAFGNVRAVGAEATRPGIDIEAAEQGWVKAEWCASPVWSSNSPR